MRRFIECRLLICFCFCMALSISCSKKVPPSDDVSKNKTGDPPVQPKVAENIQIVKPRTKFNPGFPGDLNKKAALGSPRPSIYKIVLSADGRRAAVSNSSNNTSGNKSKTQVWDISDLPKQVAEFDGHVQAISADGNRLVLRRTNTVVIGVERGEKLLEIGFGPSHCYFVSPDRVIGMHKDNLGSPKAMAHIYDISTGQLVRKVEIANHRELNIAPPTNGNREIVIGITKTDQIRVTDLTSDSLVREFTLPAGKLKQGLPWWNFFAVSSDAKRIATVRSAGSAVEIFDGVTGEMVLTLPAGLSASASDFVPERDLFMTPSNIARADKNGDWTEYVAFDLKKQNVVAAFRGHEARVLSFAISSDGKVMASGDEAGNVLIWDLAQLN